MAEHFEDSPATDTDQRLKALEAWRVASETRIGRLDALFLSMQAEHNRAQLAILERLADIMRAVQGQNTVKGLPP